MATQVSKVSDLDGSPNADIGAVVRNYLGLAGGDRILDITQEQMDALAAKAVKDVLTVELRMPDSSTRTLLVTKKELDAWLGKPEVLENAAHLKGRRPGFSPNGNGQH